MSFHYGGAEHSLMVLSKYSIINDPCLPAGILNFQVCSIIKRFFGLT